MVHRNNMASWNLGGRKWVVSLITIVCVCVCACVRVCVSVCVCVCVCVITKDSILAYILRREGESGN